MEISQVGTILKFGIMSALPIICWLFFFQKQNRESRKFVLWTFVAGMLSVLPVKMYEKIWNVSVFYLEHVNMFQYLADIVHVPALPRVFAFILVSALVSAAFFVATAVLMFFVEVFAARTDTVSVFRRKCSQISESPFIFLTVGALFGISAYFLSEFFPSKVWFFVVVGMLEEFVKYLMLRFADEEHISSVSDAISFAIVVALGFAFVENIIYLSRFWETANGDLTSFTAFYLLRSTVSVIAHVCFSAILGYFYGISKFSTEIYREEAKKNQHPVLRMMHKVFHVRGSVLFHEEKLFEGMLLAMLVHAVFNSLLETGKIGLVFPLLFISFGVVLNLLHRKSTHIRRGLLNVRPRFT